MNNPFFVDEEYFYDMEDYLHTRQLENTEEINALPDDWKEKIELSSCEKVITIEESFFDDLLEFLIDRNEERFPEDSDTTQEKIKVALKNGINIKKINKLMPELWYPNDEEKILTKKDLLDAL